MSPTGPLYPTVVAQDASGTQAWSNLANAKVEDGLVASALEGPGGGGGLANELLTTGFGFAIPSSAVIDGIKLEIKVATTGGNVANDSPLTSSQVYLLYNGGNTNGAVTPNKGQTWPLTTLTWLTYGSATDLWGKAWTPADINNANFGAAMAALSGTGTANINVDSVRITVYWHTAPASVPKRYIYKVFNSAGVYLGNMPNVISEFTFSQDINTAGATIGIECGVSPDTSSQPVSVYTAEDGVTPYTDEAGTNNYTTEGGLPIVALGNVGYDVLVKNGNKVKVYEYSYFYPNGKAMFSGMLEHIEGGFGGDSGHDSIQMTVYSDGSDLDNYIARGAPFSYTTDQSQATQNSSETINSSSGKLIAYNKSGQSFIPAAANVGAITVMLNGSANVTINLWTNSSLSTLLGTTTQAVSVGAPTTIQFAFPSIITVTPGTSYFFEVLVADGQSILIYYQNTDVYANGQHYTASYGGGAGGGFGSATGDLYFVVASGTGSTTGTYTSKDPSTQMLIPIVADYNLRGGLITCSTSTVDATGLSLTYGLNTNTILEALGGVYSMAPSGFYWYVDLGADQLYFKNSSTTADFMLTKGLHLNDVNLVLSVENVKNQIYFSGGTVSGSNIYTSAQDVASINAYGVRLDRQSDNRVTDLPTAQTIVKGSVKKQKDEQQQTVVRVLSTTITDITLLRPGKTIGFQGFGTFVDSLILQVVRWEYHPEYVVLTLGILPKRMSPKFEQIVRGLVAQQTVANPSVPS